MIVLNWKLYKIKLTKIIQHNGYDYKVIAPDGTTYVSGYTAGTKKEGEEEAKTHAEKKAKELK